MIELNKNILLTSYDRDVIQEILCRVKIPYTGIYSNHYPSAILATKYGGLVGVDLEDTIDKIKEGYITCCCDTIDDFVKEINESYIK